MTLLFTKIFIGITPAHAGNTSNCGSEKDNLRDHPRTRGEYDIWDLTVGYQEGSPPHTRGILLSNLVNVVFGWITPAHAGNTEQYHKHLESDWDHPRTRGEYSKDK